VGKVNEAVEVEEQRDVGVDALHLVEWRRRENVELYRSHERGAALRTVGSAHLPSSLQVGILLAAVGVVKALPCNLHAVVL
jgi:hypothetical protein